MNFSKTSYFIHLKHFLAQLFALLPENYKVMFINKYPPINYPFIWVCLSLNHFPSSHFSELNKIVVKCLDYTEDFLKGKCSLESFKIMVRLIKFKNTFSIKLNSFRSLQYICCSVYIGKYYRQYQ